ncbi:MFS general substrate transporter [Polychaeton citri CBS 116435]|uniref:MFS general substrate transporter n=1 Tax=Polychaeton citri CBS 116435 TaxID=1314669 RepID=A0A9P4QAW5_9PEZI|nr:MFS general substrate transporter [Polychaeton citri CBS 116435]
MEHFLDPAWPPGTVRLSLNKSEDIHEQVILQPRPTDDPNDPLNWTRWQKAVNYTLASFYTLMVWGFIYAGTATWGPMGEELNFSNATLINTYAMGVAALCVGAPMLIPFALKYGSRCMYIVSTAAQLGISIWAARTQNVGDWWAVNALCCWVAALAEVMIQMTVADVFFVHQRGLMNTIYIWMSLAGQNLAPLAAGFVTVSQGWRWVWWWFAIIFGIQLIAFILGFEETKFDHLGATAHAQVNEAHITSTMVHSPTNNNDEKDERVAVSNSSVEQGVPSMPSSEEDLAHTLGTIHINPNKKRKPYMKMLALTSTTQGSWSHVFRHTYQPFIILFTIPGVLYCSTVYAILVAWATVQISALSIFMLGEPWNFSPSQIGLMSIPPFIGGSIGSLLVGPLSDWLVVKLAKRNGGIYEPEMRFWAFIPFIPLQVGGGFWMGYALQNGLSWVHVAMAFGVTNVGLAPLSSIPLTYICDAYNEIVGDSLTGLTFVRNLVTTIFVYAIPPAITSIGIANLFNIIGAIAIPILCFAGYFIWKGKHLRHKTAGKYRKFASQQFIARPL